MKLIAAAHLIFETKGKIFLMKRFNTGYQDGRFGLPAGHKESGETFLECAIREAYEEAGVRVKESDVEFVHAIHKYSRGVEENHGNRLEIFFRTNKWEGELRIIEPTKCDDANWYSKNKLPENMVDYVGESLKIIYTKKQKKHSFHEKSI